MCEYFVQADPILYEQRTRTVRIHGVLTSIRLENMVWDTLAQMAQAQHCSTNSLIVQFHDEILAHRGEVPNFASFLRVTGMRFLSRELRQARRALQAAPNNEIDGEFDSAGIRPDLPDSIPTTALPLPVSANVVALHGR
jgi:predicted DNA-binding ribbon-helix-helix protein